MRLFGLVGAGGFGREVMPLVKTSAAFQTARHTGAEAVFVIERGHAMPAKTINGYRVMYLDDFLAAPCDARYFNIAIGSSKVRQRIAEAIPPSSAEPFEIRAPNFLDLESNSIGEGAIFCGFSHVTSNARIGRFFHCNIYSYVAHDCVVGDYVTFAPGVKCNGHVVIEDHAYIGTGAIIRDGTNSPIVIGKGAVVGMGAVVTKSVPPGSVVIGNPARLHIPGGA